MKVEELRIGNWVHPFKDTPYRVVGISGVELYLTQGDGFLKPTIEQVEPIPLTEEWLLKFGFEQKESRMPYFQKNSLVTYKQDGIFWIDYYDTCIELYYVHQLQNLYFALTNKEL